ncbi:MAG: hypothetical protein HGA87_01985 [Desulfobulbaceae bacterium]|nr:hypothetical protein [Desulfobulbaceae bacterium]
MFRRILYVLILSCGCPLSAFSASLTENFNDGTVDSQAWYTSRQYVTIANGAFEFSMSNYAYSTYGGITTAAPLEDDFDIRFQWKLDIESREGSGWKADVTALLIEPMQRTGYVNPQNYWNMSFTQTLDHTGINYGQVENSNYTLANQTRIDGVWQQTGSSGMNLTNSAGEQGGYFGVERKDGVVNFYYTPSFDNLDYSSWQLLKTNSGLSDPMYLAMYFDPGIHRDSFYGSIDNVFQNRLPSQLKLSVNDWGRALSTTVRLATDLYDFATTAGLIAGTDVPLSWVLMNPNDPTTWPDELQELIRLKYKADQARGVSDQATIDALYAMGEFNEDDYLRLYAACPVDLKLRDKNGHVLSEDELAALGGFSLEGDFLSNGDKQEMLVLPKTLRDKYSLSVVPESGAGPNDQYSLFYYNGTDDAATTLALNQLIGPDGASYNLGNLTVTPEPAAGLLFLSGLPALAFFHKRHKS